MQNKADTELQISSAQLEEKVIVNNSMNICMCTKDSLQNLLLLESLKMLLYYKSTGKYKIHMDAIITNAEPSH
jgi:hypothetical protein